jgi:dCTP deaminase
MILTDREIKMSMESGLIGIKPEPKADAYSSTSVDLTLGPLLRKYHPPVRGLDVVIDPGMDDYDIIQLLEGVTDQVKIAKEGYVLEPGPLILGWTNEKVELNTHGRVAARVEGKSSLARVGLAVHVTAPTIHSGFSAPIQLELVNHGWLPIRLHVGMSICQLIFEQTLGIPDKGYRGRFQGQVPG